MTFRISQIAIAGALAVASSPLAAQDTDQLREELAQMRAEMNAMSERIEALETELAETEAAATAATAQASMALATAETASAQATEARVEAEKGPSIAFKGAPQIKGENGWSFKPRGRLQYDAGTISVPDSTGVVDGFGSEARRARLGVSGDMPGGFGYKFEIDFAGNDVSVTDALISYETGNTEFQVGQFNNFQSLEELTSSLHTSFIERAAFTDAFGFERRVGAAAIFKGGDVLVQTGVFTDNMEDLSNKSWSADGRVVFMPKLGDAQLHLGGSVHYTDIEDGDTVRYRQRPLVHFTSERFINTDRLAADSEFGFGVEGAFIAGPFHAAAEGFWQNVRMPGAMENPTFFGGYAEVGYFLTKGDTRGYKGGKFDRTKPANPVGEGGMGSLQFNLRYDRLDLNDAMVVGGTQDGFLASLVWKPTDWTMLLANYGRLEYTDAVFPTATGDRDYGVDAFAVRAQIDF
ncbi:OprO/OprP family phosphate-selective porin [Erythrobacter sp. THAF29]|uniref:OprO/OprP family phosphate-selective porin n=1 Tax=Erythrobacter sp. THAF29 TaxID=2587851 RepID=UPI001269407E|nr:porin [Erythrobacter sp. THAF29]QFT76591.1 Porin P precursor [Erythrobacter sp. THAF29]